MSVIFAMVQKIQIIQLRFDSNTPFQRGLDPDADPGGATCTSFQHDANMARTGLGSRISFACIWFAFASGRFLPTWFSWQVSSTGSGLQGGLNHTRYHTTQEVLKN